MSRQKVMVAMSGGVDSSVAAYLLQNDGYEVIGFTLNTWPEQEDRLGGCCGLSAVSDARRVARRLGIPHYVLNYREIFEEKVVGYFCREYLEGRTPNPCIACNRTIKFGALLGQADALGIPYLATGHYARITRQEDGHFHLFRALDHRKDQSYVLFELGQRELARVLFPLGGLTKSEVRSIAREIDLNVADKPESQEICFVPDNDYRSFVFSRHPEAFRPGVMVDTEGRVVGHHKGLAHFTIGQRHGLGIAAGRPVYVVNLIPETNTVVIGDRDHVMAREGLVGSLSWVSGEMPQGEIRAMTKVRYTAPAVEASIVPEGNEKVRVVFDRPVWALTPGQAAVFYQGEEVLGGGTIEARLS